MSLDTFLQSNASGLDYPTIRPSLDLNFARSKTLDPRITFTRSSTGTYVGSDGLIKTAIENEPRFDHDPLTGECRGLLIEESRTNFIPYSDSLQDRTATQTGLTIIPNAAISPNGTFTASLLTEDTGTNTHSLKYNTSLQNRTFSVFVKPAGRIRFRIWGQNQNPFAAFLLTGSGSVYDSYSASASITSYPNGWYKCIISSTVLDTNFIGFGPTASDVFYPTTWTSNYTGDGTSGIYIWGAQLETGSFATSYIPTSASTVTRSADNASMTGSNFTSWYNQSEGTVFTNVKILSSTTLTDKDYGAWFGAGSNASSGIRHDYSNGASPITAGILDIYSNAILYRSSIYYTNSTSRKAASSFGTGSLKYCFNGVLGTTETSNESNLVMPNNIDRLLFGGYNNVNGQNKIISRFTYWNKRLTNSQLQLLTK